MKLINSVHRKNGLRYSLLDTFMDHFFDLEEKMNEWFKGNNIEQFKFTEIKPFASVLNINDCEDWQFPVVLKVERSIIEPRSTIEEIEIDNRRFCTEPFEALTKAMVLENVKYVSEMNVVYDPIPELLKFGAVIGFICSKSIPECL